MFSQKFFLKVSIIQVATFLIYTNMGAISPENPNPTIDLSQAPLHIKAQKITGQWAFYWMKLIDPQTLNHDQIKPDNICQVPNVWIKALAPATLPGQGYATYQTKVNLPTNMKSAALYCHPLPASYKLFIDQKMIFENGKTGTNQKETEPGFEYDTVFFPLTSSTITITLQIANYSFVKGGPKKPFYIGTDKTIKRIGLPD